MKHDAPKAEIVYDSKTVLEVLKRAGAQPGSGSGVDTAALQHQSK